MASIYAVVDPNDVVSGNKENIQSMWTTQQLADDEAARMNLERECNCIVREIVLDPA